LTRRKNKNNKMTAFKTGAVAHWVGWKFPWQLSCPVSLSRRTRLSQLLQ
jgi:hypothetical protein